MGHRQSRIEHWGAVMARFGESGQEPAAFCREGGEKPSGQAPMRGAGTSVSRIFVRWGCRCRRRRRR